jgi:hypothetical protein
MVVYVSFMKLKSRQNNSSSLSIDQDHGCHCAAKTEQLVGKKMIQWGGVSVSPQIFTFWQASLA